MKFDSIVIENFRNFENVGVELSNANVVFGLNDSGKTNFLTAIRTILDYKYRNNISEADFYKFDTARTIKIELSLKFESNDEDSDFIVSMMKGAMSDKGQENQAYIILQSNWDDQNMVANTEIRWGNNKTKLESVPSVGLMRTKIDQIFDVIYLEALADGTQSFSQYRRSLDATMESDEEQITRKISKKFSEINDLLASTSLVKSAEDKLTKEYKKLRNEDVEVVIKSGKTVGSITDGLTPYITIGNEGTFPASGDGRQKFLSYAVQNALVYQRQQKNFKITLFLIEEPENSLHKSLQKSFSRRLFAEEEPVYKHFFMTTHSSDIVSEMDKTMLIRLGDSDMKSSFYTVDPEFSDLRRGYNAEISEAIFYRKVLLVEGPSEKILLEAIGEKTKQYPEEKGFYIMPVYGIGFDKFYKLLSQLGIIVLVRTDNDIKPNNDGEQYYSFPGIKRLIALSGSEEFNSFERWNSGIQVTPAKYSLKSIKECVWESDDRQKLAQKGLFLARNDLESDMMIVASSEIKKDLENNGIRSQNVVDWFQRKKSLHMVEFIKIFSDKTADKLLNSMAGFREFFDDEY